ncbi:EamA family transporter [Candidatus Micrarchaeota archaeon]|nr:EamA family transporter [Candidatus Micrarchaeota archaeon]
MKEETKALIELNLGVLLLSMVGLFGKWIELPATIIILGRVFFATIALFTILKLSKQSLVIKSKKELGYLVIMGIFFGIHMVAFFESVQISTVAIAMITIYTYPLFITFLEPLLSKEKLRGIDIILALVVLLGVILIVPNFEIANDTFKGVLWGLLAAFTFSVATVMNRKYVQSYSSSLIMFYETAISFIILIPFLFIEHFIIKTIDLFLVMLLGVVFTAIAYTLFVKGMKYIKAQKAGLIATIEPVYSIFFAAIFLAEIPELRTLIGAALILGVAIFTQLKMEN